MYVIALLQGRWWCPMCGQGWGWSMMIAWLVILAVIVVVGWYVVRGALPGGLDGRSRRTEAEEILRQRYARGEIDRDTYLHMREDLRRPPGE